MAEFTQVGDLVKFEGKLARIIVRNYDGGLQAPPRCKVQYRDGGMKLRESGWVSESALEWVCGGGLRDF